jgi:hypothetical protein
VTPKLADTTSCVVETELVVQNLKRPLGEITRVAYLTVRCYEQEECKMATKGQHVVPNGGKWSVRKAGASKVTFTFSTQDEAIQEARKIARNQGTELYIHGRDGRIRERDSYGNDPRRLKG